MQRSCADVNSPYKRSAELTRGALYLTLYSEVIPSPRKVHYMSYLFFPLDGVDGYVYQILDDAHRVNCSLNVHNKTLTPEPLLLIQLPSADAKYNLATLREQALIILLLPLLSCMPV
jgi:hypothetical protein